VPPKSSRTKPDDATDDGLTDSQWNECLRLFYDRRRLKGKQLRQADIARRKARELPDTLLEAIEKHLRAQPRVPQRDTFKPLYSSPQCHIEKLADAVTEILADDPVLLALSEAAALSPAERLAKWGGLVGLPFDCIATLPPHMTDPEYRFELPRWCLAARYDCGIRDDYFVDLLDGKVDQPTLDKRLGEPTYFNPYSAPVRSLRPDEVGLDGTQRAHLKKLRDKLKRALDYLGNIARVSQHAPSIDKARAYVATAEAAIRAARASYGLPEVEPPEAT
jgi:hypothetical protein